MSEESKTDLNARVAVLEDWREEQRAWMSEIRGMLNTLNSSFLQLRLCGSPNLCVSLKAEIEEHSKDMKSVMDRIESLEKWRTFMSGVVATIAVLWAVIKVIGPWLVRMFGQQ